MWTCPTASPGACSWLKPCSESDMTTMSKGRRAGGGDPSVSGGVKVGLAVGVGIGGGVTWGVPLGRGVGGINVPGSGGGGGKLGGRVGAEDGASVGGAGAEALGAGEGVASSFVSRSLMKTIACGANVH